MSSDFKRGECRWCGRHDDVYKDNLLCLDCDSDVIYCRVCKEEQHAHHDKCRHVFQDQYFQWNGAGVGLSPDANVRTSFFDLLTEMPRGFATDLRRAIRSGKFYTWLIAPLIGSGGLLELHGMDYRTGRNYGDAMMELGEHHPDDEGMADGYRWLASLYKRSTLKANRLTIRWIDEWQEEREGALLRLADDGCPNQAR